MTNLFCFRVFLFVFLISQVHLLELSKCYMRESKGLLCYTEVCIMLTTERRFSLEVKKNRVMGIVLSAEPEIGQMSEMIK